MTKPTSQGEFDSLQSIFADIVNNGDEDPIERIVVLTYEFDDQQLVNLIAGRQLDEDFNLRTNHLRFIAGWKPLIVYDASKTRAFNELPHFLDLIPVRAAPYSCHHAKAYLIVTTHAVRLVLGSFNLTRTGLFSNREVFMDFMWSNRERAHAGVLRSFIELLRDGYADHPQATASAALRNVAAMLTQRLGYWSNLEAVPPRSREYELLASGYAKTATGLQQLSAQWKKISPTSPPSRMVVVSPFFDRGQTFLVDALNDSLGPIAEIVIYTDADNAGLSKRHYGELASRRSLHRIPTAVSDTELARIAAANDGARLGDLQIVRKLHAKILILCGEGRQHLVYIGSANFTNKAWNGDNHELGLAWVEQGTADNVVAPVLQALAASVECGYTGLPDELDDRDPADQDVLYHDEPGYPAFIERIELRALNGRKNVEFNFSCTPGGKLSDYDIAWGDTVIVVCGGSSQNLRWDESAIPLLGKRNLCFTLRGRAEAVFYLPFHHAPELLEYTDLLLFSNPEDWLLHHLRPKSGSGAGNGEQIPGEPPDPLVPPVVPDSTATVDRESNVVIAMQRHLSLFSDVEQVFRRRVEEIAALPDSEEQWARRVEAPLMLYAKLLNKERAASNSKLREQIYSFKLGELALFCKALAAVVPGMAALARRLGKDLPPDASQPPVLRTYLKFCKKELK
jgi:HKD family nuclease